MPSRRHDRRIKFGWVIGERDAVLTLSAPLNLFLRRGHLLDDLCSAVRCAQRCFYVCACMGGVACSRTPVVAGRPIPLRAETGARAAMRIRLLTEFACPQLALVSFPRRLVLWRKSM